MTAGIIFTREKQCDAGPYQHVPGPTRAMSPHNHAHSNGVDHVSGRGECDGGYDYSGHAGGGRPGGQAEYAHGVAGRILRSNRVNSRQKNFVAVNGARMRKV